MTQFVSYSDDEIAFAYPMKRGPSELQLSREYPEVQEENKKILQTIENALKQLNLVSTGLAIQYGTRGENCTTFASSYTGKNSYERTISQQSATDLRGVGATRTNAM